MLECAREPMYFSPGGEAFVLACIHIEALPTDFNIAFNRFLEEVAADTHASRDS